MGSRSTDSTGRAMAPVVQVRTAHPAEGDLDDRLIGGGIGIRQLFDAQVAGGVGHNSGIRHGFSVPGSAAWA